MLMEHGVPAHVTEGMTRLQIIHLGLRGRDKDGSLPVYGPQQPTREEAQDFEARFRAPLVADGVPEWHVAQLWERHLAAVTADIKERRARRRGRQVSERDGDVDGQRPPGAVAATEPAGGRPPQGVAGPGA